VTTEAVPQQARTNDMVWACFAAPNRDGRGPLIAEYGLNLLLHALGLVVLIAFVGARPFGRPRSRSKRARLFPRPLRGSLEQELRPRKADTWSASTTR
jgi:hypothetical protein